MTEQINAPLCIYAKVTLQTRAENEEKLSRVRKQTRRRTHKRVSAALLAANHIGLRVSLSAEDSTGRRIENPGSFGIGGARRGVAAIWVRYHGPPLPVDEEERIELLRRTYRVGPHDIEDVINQMLGRDPKSRDSSQVLLSRLAEALAKAGIHATEDELTSAPLVVELDSDVRAELERS